MIRSPRVVTLLFAAVCTYASAQDDADLDRTPEDCIQLRRVDRTEVIDDNTIVFHMRGRDQIYINYLPNRCPNLAREDRFTYQVRTSRICDSTTITVIEGAGRFPGFTCRLGKFQPASIEEVEELRLVAERRSRGNAIEVNEVGPSDEGRDDDAEEVGEDEEADE